MQNFGDTRSIRLDKETEETIEACPGRNFPEKLRYAIDRFRSLDAKNIENTRREWQEPMMIEGGTKDE